MSANHHNKHPNAFSHEKSPALQHAYTLTTGCHVITLESIEDHEVTDLLDQHFIVINVYKLNPPYKNPIALT